MQRGEREREDAENLEVKIKLKAYKKEIKVELQNCTAEETAPSTATNRPLQVHTEERSDSVRHRNIRLHSFKKCTKVVDARNHRVPRQQ